MLHLSFLLLHLQYCSLFILFNYYHSVSFCSLYLFPFYYFPFLSSTFFSFLLSPFLFYFVFVAHLYYLFGCFHFTSFSSRSRSSAVNVVLVFNASLIILAPSAPILLTVHIFNYYHFVSFCILFCSLYLFPFY